MQEAELQPTSDAAPDHIAVDETVIQENDERRWLYAAVGPETNKFLHFRLFPTRTTQLTVLFFANCNSTCRSLKQRFWSMMPTISKLRCRGSGSDFRCVTMEIGTPSNVSLER